MEKELLKKPAPAFSAISLRTFKRNLKAKIKKRKLTKYMNDMDKYFLQYIKGDLEKKKSKIEVKSRDPFKSNLVLFASSSVGSYNNEIGKSNRGSMKNLEPFIKTLEIPQTEQWMK
jgi:hypothetical protein